jgi:Cysteine-rich CWC
VQGVDPTSCPLCGKSNACGIAAGEKTCWCFEAVASQERLERIPAHTRGKACICRACLHRQDAENG